MLVYAANFMLKKIEITDFINLVIEWVTNPNSIYDIKPFIWNGEEEQVIKSPTSKTELSIYVLIEKNTVAVKLKTIDQDNIEWENQYSLVDNELYVQLQKHSSDDEIYLNSQFHLPYLLKMLFDKDFIINNSCFNNNGYATMIDEKNYDKVVDLIINGNGYDLPIIYISKQNNTLSPYEYPVDYKYLSKKLMGLAYVLIEKDKKTSQNLKEQTNWGNPYNGAVQIYFNNGHSKRLLPNNFTNEKSMRNEIYDIVFNRNFRIKKDDKFSLTYITNEIYKIRINNLENKGKNLESLEEEKHLDKELIESLKEELSKAKKDIFSYQSKIDNLQAALDKQIENEPLLNRPDILDLYNGEIFDCIFDNLKKAKENSDCESRTYQILESIIVKNKPNYVGDRKEKMDKILRIMHNRSKLSTKDIGDLKSIGLTFSGDSHPKVRFPDAPQMVTLNKTPSDKVHGISNSCNKMLKILF